MNIKLAPSDKKYAELFLKWRNHESMRNHNPITNQSLEELRIRLEEEGKGFDSLYNIKALRLVNEIYYGLLRKDWRAI